VSREVRVRVIISGKEMLRMYRGEIKDAVARDVNGRLIRFPASILRSFVSADGVNGEFIIRYDENNRFKEIVRAQ